VHTMSFRICTMNDLRVDLSLPAGRGVFRCDTDGLETGELLKELEYKKTYRKYVCIRCGVEKNGSDNFDEMRQHLGKPHELIDPFVIDELTS